MDLEMEFNPFYLFPIYVQKCQLTSPQASFKVGVNKDEESNQWELKFDSSLSLDDIHLETSNFFVNWLIDTFHDGLVGYITGMLPSASKYMQSLVSTFNEKVAYNDQNAFLYDVLQFSSQYEKSYLYPMNLSLTQAPAFNKEQNLVSLSLNGLFYDIEAQTSHVAPSRQNSIIPPRYNKA